MGKYILALDQGTTSSRCIIYDKKGNMVSVAQKEFTQVYPKDGWVEHDPMEIWSTQMGVAQEALLKVGLTYKNIEAIGITNQRETTVVWDKDTGMPVYNAIVWQCRRTAEYCDSLIEAGHEPTVIIYPGVRHEILNEDCKEKVYNDILGWTQSILQGEYIAK